MLERGMGSNVGQKEGEKIERLRSKISGRERAIQHIESMPLARGVEIGPNTEEGRQKLLDLNRSELANLQAQLAELESPK